MTAGIIAEYNPFHNGHKYQIEKIKERHSRVIAIMSGSFVQRGDAAIADKWTRAKAAITGGCDLVLELPVCYSLNSAREFARGAVSILDRTRVVDALCFGAECGDINELKNAAKLLYSEPPEVSARIKKYVLEGLSYPKARNMAFSDMIDNSLLLEPNNILAVEYIRAILELKSNINPFAIKRAGAEHNSLTAVGNIASASHIRELIAKGADYSQLVPKAAYEIYKTAAMPYNISNIDSLIIGFLRLSNSEYLKEINDISEGLENRILECAKLSSDFTGLCEAVKTKRYTLSRIRRAVLSAVLGLKTAGEVNYIRALAMNDTGRGILREIKEKSDLKIITKTSLYKEPDKMFDLDIRSTDIFALCAPDNAGRAGGRDFTVSPALV